MSLDICRLSYREWTTFRRNNAFGLFTAISLCSDALLPLTLSSASYNHWLSKLYVAAYTCYTQCLPELGLALAEHFTPHCYNTALPGTEWTAALGTDDGGLVADHPDSLS